MRKRGWNWLIMQGRSSSKWHYFGEDGRSYCGRYLILSNNADAEDDRDNHPDNCKACAKKVKSMREKEKKAT